MNAKILQQLSAVLNALDNISVSGRQNLANLSGSISVLEDVMSQLSAYFSAESAKQGDEERKE